MVINDKLYDFQQLRACAPNQVVQKYEERKREGEGVKGVRNSEEKITIVVPIHPPPPSIDGHLLDSDFIHRVIL